MTGAVNIVSNLAEEAAWATSAVTAVEEAALVTLAVMVGMGVVACCVPVNRGLRV